MAYLSFGNTWWGKQWLQSLGNIDYESRLPRGRAYAGKGAVVSIKLTEKGIEAKVQGTRPNPYQVDIKLTPFSPKEKATLLSLITENPFFLSQLLNREVPAELHEACENADIHLFPRSWRDMHGSCSCPDWAVPCKHMAAALYLTANEIDKNPFWIFDLRGFDILKGLAAIGFTGSESKAISIPRVPGLMDIKEAVQPGQYEWDEELYQQIDLATIPDCKDQLLTLLRRKPVFYPEGDFWEELRLVYNRIAKSFRQMETSAEADENTLRQLDRVENVHILTDPDLALDAVEMEDAEGNTIFEFQYIEELLPVLESIPPSRLELQSPALRYLHLLTRLAQKLVRQSAFIPQLLESDSGDFFVRWLPAMMSEEVAGICEKVRRLCPPDFISCDEEALAPIEEEYFQMQISLFIDHYVHNWSDIPENHVSRFHQLFFNSLLIPFRQFANREAPGAIHLWLGRFYITQKNYVPILNVTDTGAEFEVNILVESRQTTPEVPVTLAHFLSEDQYKSQRVELLRDLAMLADHFPQIRQLVANGGITPLRFNSEEFVEILLKTIPVFRLMGIRISMPRELHRLIRPQSALLLDQGDDGKVTIGSGIISLDEMLVFRWQVAIGDDNISVEEFLRMTKQMAGIVKWKEQYVYFDEKELRVLSEKLKNPPELTSRDLLQAALIGEYAGGKVTLSAAAQKIFDELLTPKPVPLPEGLKASLRPYQQRGFEWLYKNSRLGMGCIIADDMGLGKTIQVITTLLKWKEEGRLETQKALVIAPTSLLTNWDREVKKFAPKLHTTLYHGPQRNLHTLKEADIALTTYGTARSDMAKLQKQNWAAIIIDEAQNIKNPAAEQTKSIKKLHAPVRIAMSGTPVENRLSEYWSLFDFSNKGYLGSLNQFKDLYARPIEVEKDHRILDRFKKVTEPFLLRRLKTDKTIIQDLPDKIEQDQYSTLTPNQAALYEGVLDTLLRDVEGQEGIERQGLILKMITALKQICNHPWQFLKSGERNQDLSGKARLLIDLLSPILENGEKALIFTQYREMGELLCEFIEENYGQRPPFLHGGVSRKERDYMVDAFQKDRNTRVLLLSLKAGGTGLNLTAANHVIHYDLWWNPAVEAQATDRAFRIGQTRQVFVHRFITKGTFEEKINLLIQSKKELADLTVAAGEKWIGDLSDKDLRRLVEMG
ncbi:MAG: DEAD/DEAH box helicase [Bacteroidia bacterium]